MKCKEQFESHIRSLGGNYNLLMAGDVYIDVETQIEWRTWQKAWQAALASQQPADDGWIDWSGGDMPPIMDEIVEAKFRSGTTDINLCRNFYWGCDEKYPHNDIIAYRVVKS